MQSDLEIQRSQLQEAAQAKKMLQSEAAELSAQLEVAQSEISGFMLRFLFYTFRYSSRSSRQDSNVKCRIDKSKMILHLPRPLPCSLVSYNLHTL